MKGRRAAWPTRRELVAVLAGGAGVFSVLLAAGLLFGPIGQLATLCVMAPMAVAVGIIIGSRLLGGGSPVKTNEWLMIVAVAIAGFFIGAISVSLLGWRGLPVAVALSCLFGQMCVMIGRR